MAKPLGGPKVDLSEPAHMLGRFVSRTNWALVLIGSILTVGGVAATMAIVYDMSTGRAGFGDVVRDIAVFIEGWFTEIFLGGFYDAEHEKTHAYPLFVLLLPGLLLLWYNVIPFFKRGNEFRSSPMVRSPFVQVPPGRRCWSTSTPTSRPTERRSSSSRRKGETR